ncbi:NAD(P)-binding domain-containing protein, partial [Nocardia brasiliensis]|uniref:NAD(P)-binding domain-containing protein n=1 Tax=Nocardia brasiliensis TaxID=37326 RepID=UPI00313CA904
MATVRPVMPPRIWQEACADGQSCHSCDATRTRRLGRGRPPGTRTDLRRKRMTSEKRTRITVLGLGRMGSAIAGRYLAADYPTTVWNRTPGRGPPRGGGGGRPPPPPAPGGGGGGQKMGAAPTAKLRPTHHRACGDPSTGASRTKTR